MAVILSEGHKRLFYASYFSISFIASLLAIIFALVLTYLVVDYSGNLFVSNILEVQKPFIEYKDQYILSVTDNNMQTKLFSSIIRYNDNYPDLLPIPLTRVSL